MLNFGMGDVYVVVIIYTFHKHKAWLVNMCLRMAKNIFRRWKYFKLEKISLPNCSEDS